MQWMRWKLAALGAALVLAGCGGGGDSRPFYTSMVTFGDSLSDVGTYKVGTVAAVGGGKWTVNSSTARNWTEVVAASAGVSGLCAAQTGLLPNIPGLTGAPVTNVATCTSYAQGSARVTHPIGPNSVALQSAPFNQMTLGLMATPLATQMSRHLAASGGAYAGSELVTVQAGGNDLFMNFAGIANASAGGSTAVGAALAAGWSAAVQNAVAAGGSAATDAAINAAMTSMAQAGADLASLIKTQLLVKGARFVVVANLPDVSLTPFGLSLDASSRGLVHTLVTSFNDQLRNGLGGTAVLLVDAYARSQQQAANPGLFGLSNITTPACSTTSPANPLGGSSLTCTTASLIAADTSGYLYADSVHPTPLGYELFALQVIQRMQAVGWL
jgi:phospholipase/lecithinase/hemolysin